MYIRKNYKVRAAMGDGRPIDAIVTAKNGTEAHDLAKKLHPAARSIYILGLADEQPEPEPEPMPVASSGVRNVPGHPFFEEETEQERKIRWCVELRKQNKSHRAIADVIGVGATTVRRWLKQYG